MGATPEIFELWPDGIDAMYGLNAVIDEGVFDGAFLELLRIRSSIVNRCGFCVSLHRKAAKGHGVESDKVRALREWEDSPLFSARERAALAYTDAMTAPGEGIDADVVAGLQGNFTSLEITHLAFAVGAINAWNRISLTNDVLVGDGN